MKVENLKKTQKASFAGLLVAMLAVFLLALRSLKVHAVAPQSQGEEQSEPLSGSTIYVVGCKPPSKLLTLDFEPSSEQVHCSEVVIDRLRVPIVDLSAAYALQGITIPSASLVDVSAEIADLDCPWPSLSSR